MIALALEESRVVYSRYLSALELICADVFLSGVPYRNCFSCLLEALQLRELSVSRTSLSLV